MAEDHVTSSAHKSVEAVIRAGSERTPTILAVFGATGDLMGRKIVPALFHLSQNGVLPDRFAVVGHGRRDWDDEYLRTRVREMLAEKYPDAPDAEVAEFCERFTYSKGTFDDPTGYEALGAKLRDIEEPWGVCSNKLFYLAVPPEHYRTILSELAQSGLSKPCSDLTGWTRILVEKPFGKDERSSHELDTLLGRLFREEQVYRIDHYLAKEMLQGIMNFRFTNNLFENSWNRDSIESIEMSLLESIGVEKRGRFYDELGAMLDVGQNHLLQMLALIAMDQPEARGAAAIRQQRAAFLRSLRPLAAEEVARASFRAQHEGYREIEGVEPDSTTETYFRLRFELTGRRWGGVPVTMEAGKRLGDVCKEIVVNFRHPAPCMCGGQTHVRNRVIFRLDPTESITISFWAKKPGFGSEIEERAFDFFLYEKTEKVQYVEEYAKLLLDAIDGDQTLFVSTDEVTAMWAFTDPIVRAWESEAVPLESYEPDSAEVTRRAAAAVGDPAARGQVGIVGLGRMGKGLALNMHDHGWDVVAYNRSPEKVKDIETHGVRGAYSLEEMVASLRPPRMVWMMLTAGQAVDAILFGDRGLIELLDPGDIVIDGGNSRFSDAPKRAERLAARDIRYMDCGTSGGPGGARNGACLMIGGRAEEFGRAQPLFADIALRGGYQFFEGHGAGHFVKMVHNGIEYGMMQAIAEGFQIMRASDYDLDLARVADVYQHGSVIESRLVGWLREAFDLWGVELEGVSGTVGHTGEGEWTIEHAAEKGLEARVISGALEFRIESERDPSYAGRLLSAMRNRFGGHAMHE